MSNFTLTKEAPTKNDKKSTAQGTMLRQQGFHEANKRRVFLQDNSWIKKRPEEEKDENYGRVVLNRHNSHDALDRKTIEGDESKATISRYRSDDTLDRISDRKDAGKACKANTLDNQLTSRYQSLSTFRSPEPTKSQPGDLFRANITTSSSSNNMASSPAPIKKKRQSWFPPPPPGHKVTESLGANKREPGAHPPIPPKPSSPISSPNLLRRDNRQVCPPKPGVPTETSSPEKNTRQICPPKPRASTETRSPEKNTRSSQDCDNIVKVDTSSQKTNKGEELDNLIIKNKSLNRKQGLDGLFRANPKTELSEKRAKSLENLIYVNSRMDKDGKGNQSFGSLTRVNQRTDKNEKGKQDLDGLIKVTPETTVNIKRGHSLENVIKATLDVNRRNQGSEDLGSLIKMNPRTGKTVQGDKSLDNLIKVTPEANRSNQGTQGLDNLIKVNPSAKKSSKQGLDELIHVNPNIVKNITGSQNLDKLIKVNPETLTNNQRNQDLANLIAVNPAVIKNNQSNQVLDKVKPPALRNTKQDLDLENVMEVNANVPENKNGRPNEQVSGSTKALHKQSSGPTSYSYESRNSLSSSVGTSHTGPKDTVVYTRTYVENSKSPRDVYAENISGKCIQTVYSTSDRSVIERDMCTYCRKPLGTETKMILDELHICCHSTCFKCEICKQPLENLKAGDSIWIYRQTIHCEPCYSKVMAKWIQ